MNDLLDLLSNALEDFNLTLMSVARLMAAPSPVRFHDGDKDGIAAAFHLQRWTMPRDSNPDGVFHVSFTQPPPGGAKIDQRMSEW